MPFLFLLHILIKILSYSIRSEYMIITKPYNRERAVEYARKWALSRNPLFFDFTGGGGNCTNFVSQSILAGTLNMNPTPTFGWYYTSIDDRSPSWTGVREFYEFVCGIGPRVPRAYFDNDVCVKITSYLINN